MSDAVTSQLRAGSADEQATPAAAEINRMLPIITNNAMRNGGDDDARRSTELTIRP